MTGTRLRILILGGYGTFGGRLAELLSGEPQLTLVIAGRSKAKAEAFCAELPTGASNEATDVRLTFDRANGVETWRRDFGTQRLTSNQYEGRGRYERLLCERFGPFVFGMALVVGEGRLSFVVRRWSFLGVALPRRLAPRSRSFEFEAEGRFRFHVEIVVPFVGPIVNYSGYLMQVRKGSGSFDRIKRPA